MEVVAVAQEHEPEEQQQEELVVQPHELVQQLQFLPGYRFVPTESELVSYLRRKIEGRELPLHVVNEVAILDWQPGSLVEAYKGYGENRWLFFTIREPSSSNKEEEPNRKVRAPGVKATWKATGSVVPITAKAEPQQQGDAGEEKVVVGTKRVLIYHSSDAEEHGKWSMHEYILNGHAKIGQYALCSIQRKQHSDEAGEEGSSSSSSSRSNKRTKATDGMDPEKTIYKKRRTNKAASATQSEVVQPQQQETTTPVELALLKPKPKTRRPATNRKNKASLDAQGQQQKQEHQEVAPVSPVEPPLTPPGQAPPRALQQEQMAPAAYSEPVGLPDAPLHGYPSPSDGMLGSSAPLHEEGTPWLSFQGHYDYDTLRALAELESMMSFCNEEGQQPASFTVDNYAQDQLYQQQYCFSDNSAQNNSSWTHGQDEIYQQETGATFGAQDQHANNAQYHEDSYYNVQPDVPLPLLAQQTGYCSSDQFTESVQGESTAASGSDADLDLINDDSFSYVMGFLIDDCPQDGVGTQDGSSPESLQSQSQGDVEAWWSCGQQQPTANGHL